MRQLYERLGREATAMKKAKNERQETKLSRVIKILEVQSKVLRGMYDAAKDREAVESVERYEALRSELEGAVH